MILIKSLFVEKSPWTYLITRIKYTYVNIGKIELTVSPVIIVCATSRCLMSAYCLLATFSLTITGTSDHFSQWQSTTTDKNATNIKLLFRWINFFESIIACKTCNKTIGHKFSFLSTSRCEENATIVKATILGTFAISLLYTKILDSLKHLCVLTLSYWSHA